MKIKYLKNAPLAKKGDVAEVQTFQANILIRLGIAEEYKAPAKPKAPTKKKTETDKE